MKHLLPNATLIWLFIFNATMLTQAQSLSVEKSITGVQIGILGLDVYHERAVAAETVLRFQLGSEFIASKAYNEALMMQLYPVFVFQPKYYYNLAQRSILGKNVKNNAANFFSFQLKYIPKISFASAENIVKPFESFQFIPTYGFRRHLGKNFNLELKGGMGYGFRRSGQEYSKGAMFDLGLKVGIDF